jgi:hypothetical protein
MNNSQIAEIFENIAGLLEMKGEKRFTVVAYQRVARTIGGLPAELEQMVRDGADLKETPGVGKAIAEKISQLAAGERMEYYERLRSEFPGVGPKTTKRLWDELGVSDVAQLEAALENGRVALLPRLGQRKSESILREIRASRTKDDRVPIARAMPERIIRAIHNPYVTAIGHLSGRLIGDRRPITAYFEAIFRAAAETGTVLEINASPERLDLKDSHIHKARELGVTLVIDSDAHKFEALDNQRFGVATARRGWCQAKHILNTLPLAEFLSFLGLEKSPRTKALSGNG